MRRYNRDHGGPIRIVNGRPEVRVDLLRAWWANVDDRARRSAQARASKAGATKELGERGGARQQDLKHHEEKRPNARGKARQPGPLHME
jgi:hypothetical protein